MMLVVVMVVITCMVMIVMMSFWALGFDGIPIKDAAT